MRFVLIFLMMISGLSAVADSDDLLRNKIDNWAKGTIYEKGRVKSLEEKYRTRMLPPSKEEAFNAGYDATLGLVDEISYEVLNRSWDVFLYKLNRTKVEKDKNDRSLGRDWLQIAEFNYEALKNWEELKACAGGNSELAREYYYKIVSECANGDKGQAKTIFSKIASFKMQVLNFLQTTDIRDPRARVEYGENRGRDRIQETIKMPLTHPLFIQVVLEAAALLYKHPKIDQQHDTYAVKTAMNYLQGKSDEIITSMYKFDEMPSSSYEYVRFLMNTKLILDSIKNEKCEEWGLWPGISQAVAHFTYSSYTQLVFDYKNELSERMKETCGSELFAGSIIFWDTTPKTEVKKNFLYTNEHIYFANEFRDLLNRYYKYSVGIIVEKEISNAKAEGKTCIFGFCF